MDKALDFILGKEESSVIIYGVISMATLGASTRRPLVSCILASISFRIFVVHVR